MKKIEKNWEFSIFPSLFGFLTFSVKKTCFPHETYLLLFDTVELMKFPIDCEIYLFPGFFRLCVPFYSETLIWSNGAPLAFTADFGLNSLAFGRRRNLFRHYDTFPEKNPQKINFKNGFLGFHLGKEWFSSLMGIPLGIFSFRYICRNLIRSHMPQQRSC